MIRNRRTQAARLRERRRAASAHPAARRRAVWRWQYRQLLIFGAQMVKAGYGRPRDFLAAGVLVVLCKLSPGVIWRHVRRMRPEIWQRVVVLAGLLIERAAYVAAMAVGRVSSVEHGAAVRRHVVTVAQPTRGPGSDGPARTVRGALMI